MAVFRVTATIVSPTGRVIRASGQGGSAAAAQSVVDKKLAVMVGALKSEKVSGDVTTPGALHAADGAYDDAVLTILKGGKEVNIQLQNVSKDYALPFSDGLLDTTNSDLQDIAAAEGGTLTGGRYTKG